MSRVLLLVLLCTFAFGCSDRGRSIRVEVTVRDPEAQAIKDATVTLVLPRYGKGRANRAVRALTDERGVVILSGYAEQDYMVRVEKHGFYYTVSPRPGIRFDRGSALLGSRTMKVSLELRPIRNPVEGIVRSIERLKIPHAKGSIGFDLLVGDWVAPYGRGSELDFVVGVAGEFPDRDNYDQTFSVTFPGDDDGLVVWQIETEYGSAQAFPYEAPSTGYCPFREWRNCWEFRKGSKGTTADLTGRTNYIFRIRSERDHAGQLSRALFGIVLGDVRFVAGDDSIGRSISFRYVINPNWSPNIEFDPAKHGHLTY